MPNIKRLMPLVGDVNGPYIAFTSRDGVAVVETERGEVPVLANDGGTLFFKAADGTLYAAIPVDGNGNAIANVNHRTGTLASLLTLAGGNGEISVATDVDALVKHTGVANEAKAFYANGIIGSFSAAGGAVTIPSGATGAALNMESLNHTSGIAVLGDVNTTLTIPSSAAEPVMVTAIGAASFGASAAGTFRSVEMQMDITGAGAWLTMSQVFSAAAAANQKVLFYFAMPASAISGSTVKIRILAKQDSGADMLGCNLLNTMFFFARGLPV